MFTFVATGTAGAPTTVKSKVFVSGGVTGSKTLNVWVGPFSIDDPDSAVNRAMYPVPGLADPSRTSSASPAESVSSSVMKASAPVKTRMTTPSTG